MLVIMTTDQYASQLGWSNSEILIIDFLHIVYTGSIGISVAFQEKGGTTVQSNYKSGLIGTEVKMSGLSRQNRDVWQL